jgi:hypothetical protein
MGGKNVENKIVVNGRLCLLRAEVKTFLWFRWTKFTINVPITTLNLRECKVVKLSSFNRGKGLEKQIARAEARLSDLSLTHLQSGSNPSFLSEFTEALNAYVLSPMDIKIFPAFGSDIGGILKNAHSFVQNNNLSQDEIAMLRRSLQDLCGKPIIQCSNDGSFSINECERIPECRSIALQVEALEILLDARECGHVRLERNVPPEIKTLGKGNVNAVKLAHAQRDGIDPIAIKPCDQSRKESGEDGLPQGLPREFPPDTLKKIKELQEKELIAGIGSVSGSYRRNKATSRLQNMLIGIGEQRRIEVPHVVATVSAAEMNGVPYIAMEALDGKTIHDTVTTNAEGVWKKKFVARETWIQLQDVLTGQIDRHGNNVMLTSDGPIAIDHDLSFPTNPPRELADTVPTIISTGASAIDYKTARNYCMPPVIDREMFDVIMAIDVDTLANMYQECGLTRLEIQSALSRARGLKEHALAMEKEGLVIDPTEWIRSEIVTQHCNESNFYAMRHYARK